MYNSTLSLASALDGGWVVNAVPPPLYPRERPGTHCIGGEMGHRAGAENLAPTGIRSPKRPARSVSLTHYATPAHSLKAGSNKI